MNRHTRLREAAGLTMLLIASRPSAAAAQAAAPRSARQILVDSNRRHRPTSEEYLGDITVISRDGKERRREWSSESSGPPGTMDRLIRFLSPPDVAGVAYLEASSRARSGRVAVPCRP